MAGLLLGQRQALELMLVLYTAVQVVVLLEPFAIVGSVDALRQRLAAGQIVLDPRASPALTADNLTSMMADMVFAVPVGILAVLVASRTAGSRPLAGAIRFCFLLYALGELAQVFIPSRHADVVDLVANLSGAIAGAAVTSALLRARAGASRGLTVRTIAVMGVLISAAFYAVHTLIPFDFEFTEAMMAARMPRLWNAPFLGYYVNPEFKALRDLFLKLALGFPLGLFARLAMGSSSSAWKTTAWILIVGAFSTALEVGQVFLPSRFPDNTDVILATTAALIGMRIVAPFSRTSAGASW
jgi:VanZ family protein